jgi:hypothetical protein
MLLPAHRAFAAKGMPPEPSPAPSPVAAVATNAVDNNVQHTDYDLHPLTVRHLDHYIEPDHTDERFHVR